MKANSIRRGSVTVLPDGFNKTRSASVYFLKKAEAKKYEELDPDELLSECLGISGHLAKAYLLGIKPQIVKIGNEFELDILDVLSETNDSIIVNVNQTNSRSSLVMKLIFINKCSAKKLRFGIELKKDHFDTFRLIQSPIVPKILLLHLYSYEEYMDIKQYYYLYLYEGGPMTLDSFIKVRAACKEPYDLRALSSIIVQVAHLMQELEKQHIYFYFLAPKMFSIDNDMKGILLTDFSYLFHAEHSEQNVDYFFGDTPKEYLAPELNGNQKYKPGLASVYYIGMFATLLAGNESCTKEDIKKFYSLNSKIFGDYTPLILECLNQKPEARPNLVAIINTFSQSLTQGLDLNERKYAKIGQFHNYAAVSEDTYFLQISKICTILNSHKKSNDILKMLSLKSKSSKYLIERFSAAQKWKNLDLSSKLAEEIEKEIKKMDTKSPENSEYLSHFYFELAEQLYKNFDYEVCQMYLLKAKSYLDPDKPRPKFSIKLYMSIGLSYEKAGDYIAAIDNFKSALDLNITLSGIDHLSTLLGQGNLGKVEIKGGLFEVGIARLQDFTKDIDVFIEDGFDFKNMKFDALQIMGEAYELMGQPEKARSFYERIVKDCKSKKSKIYITSLLSVINVSRSTSDQSLNIRNYESCIAIVRTGRSEELVSGFIADIYNNIATCYFDMGELENGFEKLEEAFKAKNRIFELRGRLWTEEEIGKDIAYKEDSTVPKFLILANYGRYFYGKRDFENAEEYFKKALENLEDCQANIEVYQYRRHKPFILDNLAYLYCEQSRFEEAIACIGEAISIRKSLGGSGIVKTLMAKGYLYYCLGKFEEAIVLYRKIIANESGSNSEVLMQACNNLSHLLQMKGDNEGSLKIIETGLEICEILYQGKENKLKISLLINKAINFSILEMLDEAKQLLDDCKFYLEIYEGEEQTYLDELADYNLKILEEKIAARMEDCLDEDIDATEDLLLSKLKATLFSKSGVA